MILWGFLAVCPVAAATIAVMVVRRRFVVVEVAGTSMAPAFSSGDRVLVRRRAGRQIRAGAVVVLPHPHDECPAWDDFARSGSRLAGTRWVIKRVAAAQGDPVPESARDAVRGAAIVPPGMLVVLGDNARSADSRTWGFLPASDVLGDVVRRLPPPSAARATSTVRAVTQGTTLEKRNTR